MTIIETFVDAVAASDRHVAVVTGATGGVGSACARMLAREGYATLLLGRNGYQLANLEAELTALTGETLSCCGYAIDLCNVDTIVELARALAPLTNLRLMLFAAGVTNNHTTDFSEIDLLTVFDINVMAPMRIVKHLMPIMLRSEHPYLINIGSRAGVIGFGNKGLYGASKAAGIRYFEALQAKHADSGLRVTSINPGWIDTPMAMSGGCKRRKEEILQPEDIAETVNWLISTHPRMLVRDVTIEIISTDKS